MKQDSGVVALSVEIWSRKEVAGGAELGATVRESRNHMIFPGAVLAAGRKAFEAKEGDPRLVSATLVVTPVGECILLIDSAAGVSRIFPSLSDPEPELLSLKYPSSTSFRLCSLSL
jgi:hypothetical protein